MSTVVYTDPITSDLHSRTLEKAEKFAIFGFYEGESELVSGFNIEYGFFVFLVLVWENYISKSQ